MNLNVYSYVHNNPIRLVDLLGEDPTPGAFERAAKLLGIEIEVIKTVYMVETGGNAFRSNGDPKILFERHYFSRNTDRKFDKTHPKISNRSAGGYGKFSEQIGKLELAVSLDEEAGYKSASYGGFQIMGENYKQAGYEDVKSFAQDLMSKDEDKHLDAFTKFIKNDTKLKESLQEKDWASFAKKYNGPGYKKNNYDNKLSGAYKNYMAEKNKQNNETKEK